MARRYVPDRGDLIWLHFTPQAGHEQSGQRPALVVSPKAYNRKVGLALVCPVTSRVKGYPFEVPLPDGGVVLADHVRGLDWRIRKARLRGKAPGEVVEEAVAKILALLQVA